MRHNPAFVRVNPNDGTLHCERHGLLDATDTQVTLAASSVSILEAKSFHHPLAWLFDRWGKFRHPEPCR